MKEKATKEIKITKGEAYTICSCIDRMPSTYFNKNVAQKGKEEIMVERSLSTGQNSILRKNRALLQDVYDEVHSHMTTSAKNIEKQEGILRGIASQETISEADEIKRDDALSEIQKIRDEGKNLLSEEIVLPVFKKIPAKDIDGWEPQSGNRWIDSFYKYLIQY